MRVLTTDEVRQAERHAGGVQAAAGALRVPLQVDAQRRQHVGAAAAAGHGPVAVLAKATTVVTDWWPHKRWSNPAKKFPC